MGLEGLAGKRSSGTTGGTQLPRFVSAMWRCWYAEGHIGHNQTTIIAVMWLPLRNVVETDDVNYVLGEPHIVIIYWETRISEKG